MQLQQQGGGEGGTSELMQRAQDDALRGVAHTGGDFHQQRGDSTPNERVGGHNSDLAQLEQLRWCAIDGSIALIHLEARRQLDGW